MATETISTTTTTIRSCNHCGKTPPSLLRCSQCKLVHYCSRSCQSLAWKGGHRHACRKSSKKKATTTASNNGGQQMNINATMTELMQHVQQMDCRTAYENMCRAQDEIERLKRQLDEMGGEEGCVDDDDADDDVSNDTVGTGASHHLETTGESAATNGIVSTQDENRKLSSKIDASPKEPTEMKQDSTNIKRAHGSWLDEGGKCSIEYLPNIKCYHITLTPTTSTTTHHQSGTLIIPKRNDLQFNMSPVPNERQFNYSQSSQTIVFYKMRLVHSSSSSSTPLLTLILPACHQPHNHHDGPTATISTDDHSISLRIYLQLIDNSSSSMDLMDNLLGMEGGSSIFSPSTTPITFINHLSCRACNSPIIIINNNNNNTNNNTDSRSTIQSVLPLPSGYWDDIEDYLICYDGQANINFNTSTMVAIRHVALEDDAVLVLHKEDIIEGGCGSGGVCTTRENVKGYGEHSAVLLGRRRKDNGTSEIVATTSVSTSYSQLWQDKSAMKGNRGNTVTCSKCCSTLGFVSGHDLNTLRFYKHLLHCGNSSSSSSSLEDDTKNVFSKYTCASFLAREMVRYAENEAIYTFIVGVSDENDWTRLGSSMKKSCECVLLHMLSWDSALVGVDGGKMSVSGGGGGGAGGGDAMRFEKVLKVIFDITIDRGQHSSGQGDDNDGTNKWTWGGIDLCCPPSMLGDEEDEEVSSTAVAVSQQQTNNKATSVRIYLSTQEYSELKSTLTTGSEYFSEVVKDAIVMSKLGMPMVGSSPHSASLSYLPLVN